MKALNAFLNEGVDDSKESFIKAVNSYLKEDYSSKTKKIIYDYKDVDHDFTSPDGYRSKYNKYGEILFRGLYFDKVDDKKLLELRKLIKTYKKDTIESWTTDSDLATIFASGNSTYDITLGTDIFDIAAKMPKDKAGVVLKMYVLKDKDIAWDAAYSIRNSDDFEISNDEDSEMIVKKHKPKLEIYAIMNNGDIEFEIED